MIVGAAVGGIVVAVLLLIIVIIIVLCCLKSRRSDYVITKGGRGDKNTAVELGHVSKRMEPVFGVPHYRIVHSYTPRNEGDLALTVGDWVTLIEAPYGGEWWQGSVGDREGWFPKDYIEYVNVQAEKKKLEEDNFKLAAAAIVAASSSFSAKHGSRAVKKEPTTRRAYTFSKKDVDSTPKLVTKLGQTPRGEGAGGGVVIENLAIERSSSNGTSRPDTPKSQRSAEIIVNPNAAYAALQGSPNATPTLAHKTHLQTASPLVVPQDPNANLTYANVDSLAGDRYIAKYDFIGSTDIELPLKKGETVIVVERAESGWCQGICAGHMGWFPESYVKPAPVEIQSQVQPRRMSEMMAGEVEELEVSEFRALHPYESSLAGDLNFPEGATVLVYWADESGWWYGAAGSHQGWFPGSYVEAIVEMSEGGSQVTSPVQGEEEEGALAGEIAAALKVRAAQEAENEPKKTKTSYKKKWSLKKRGSRKDSETEAASHSEGGPATHVEGEAAVTADPVPSEPLASPRARLTSEEGLGLQEEISAALSSVFSTEGRSKKMSIDERVALMKERRASEDQAKESELMAVLTRRTSKKDSPQPQSPTPVAETVVKKEPESPREFSTTPQEGDRREDSSTPQERLEPEGSEAVPERSETPWREGEGEGGEKEKREPVMERRERPAGEAREATASSPATPHLKKAVSQLGKPKRRAPPPPAGAVPVMLQRVASPPSPVHPKHSVTATLPTHIKASAALTEDIPKSHTMASGKSPSARPKAQKRRTTGADHKGKPRRTPPPPPQAALAAVLRSNPINKLEPVTEDTDSVFVDDTRRSTVPLIEPAPARAAKRESRKLSGPTKLSGPSRMRPRVQRVKRPLSRNIPPPPNIPLPPTPVRKIPAAAQQTSENQEPGGDAPRKTSLTKPAVKPKPAHLSEAILLKRKKSETSAEADNRVPSPNLVEDGTPTASPRKRGPKPPPPARTSSLMEQPSPVQGRQKPTLASISASTEGDEEVDSVQVRSLPPSYPPPPRPASVLSGNQDEPDGQVKPVRPVRKKSDAPERPPPPRPGSGKFSDASGRQKSEEDRESTNWGASLKRKGSSLMQSLKRMVKKSESGKDLEAEEDGEGAPVSVSGDSQSPRPPKPSEPPPTPTASLSPTLGIEDASRHTESPIPKPRTKLPKQKSAEDSKQTSESTKSEEESKVKPKPVPLLRAHHSPSPDMPSSPPASPSTPNNFFRAVKSYKAQRSVELSFSAGDILIEVDRPDDEFIYGMLDDGNTGLFPISCVESFYSPSSSS